MLIALSFKKSLTVEQFQENYLNLPWGGNGYFLELHIVWQER